MAEQNPQRLEWYKQRVETIHRTVSAYDVLRHIGVDLKQSADDREEQFSCPFHGADNKPSARVYPDDANSRSHVWCYVCQEPHWDAIGLWKKHNNVSFGAALSGLERTFGIETPELPKELKVDAKEFEDPRLALFKKMFLACDNRLLSLKSTYKKLGDRVGFLSASSVLDRVKHRVDHQVWKPAKGIATLEALLQRIQERVDSCLED